MRKLPIPAFATLLILNFSASAQTDTPQSTPGPATNSQSAADQALAARTCELPKIADTSPLKSVAGSDLMTVPVAINGTAQKFLLDLGVKKPTSVSPELMAKLGLPEDYQVGEPFGAAPGTPFGAEAL